MIANINDVFYAEPILKRDTNSGLTVCWEIINCLLAEFGFNKKEDDPRRTVGLESK